MKYCAHMYTHTQQQHTHTHTHTHKTRMQYVCVCVCVCICVCMHVCMYVCMYVCKCIYIHSYTYTHAAAVSGGTSEAVSGCTSENRIQVRCRIRIQKLGGGVFPKMDIYFIFNFCLTIPESGWLPRSERKQSRTQVGRQRCAGGHQSAAADTWRRIHVSRRIHAGSKGVV